MKRLLFILLLFALSIPVLAQAYNVPFRRRAAAAGATFAVMRTTSSTAIETQDITTSDLGGATPEGVILIMVSATTDNTAADHALYSLGSATGSSNQSIAREQDRHGLTTTDGRNQLQVGQISTLFVNDGGGVDCTADFDSFISNGVRIDWSSACDAAYFIGAIFIDDPDAIVSDSTTTAITPYNETALGASATVVFTYNTSSIGPAPNDFMLAAGFYANDGTIESGGLFVHSDDNVGTTDICSLMWDGFIGGEDSSCAATTPDSYQALTNHASGFTSTVTGNPDDNDGFGYLAANVTNDVHVGHFTTKTSEGTQAITGTGFTPQFVALLCGISTTTATTRTDTGGTFMYGFATGPADEFSFSASMEDGVTTSNTQTLSDDVILNLPDHGGSALEIAELSSLDSDGFTLNYTSASGTAHQCVYLAVE